MKFSIFQFFNTILPVSFFTVAGDSMQPALHHGTKVITVKLLLIREGDIIVFKKPSKKQIFIKRVDKIRLNTTTYEYFVIGDNKNESTDSRDFGWIEKKNILGKVIYPRR